MKRLSFIYPLLVSFSLLTACDKGGDSNNNNNTSGQAKFVQSSVAGAQYLYQTGSPSTYLTVDKDGNAAPVSFTDDKGQTVTPEQMQVYNISEKYLLVESITLRISQASLQNYNDVILVDKATGAAHNLNVASTVLVSSNSKNYYTDKNGDIYVIGRVRDESGVIKINTTDFTAERYVEANSTGSMFVDRDGICCLSDDSNSAGFYGEEIQGRNCRLMHPAGQIYTLDELLPQAQGTKYMVLGPDAKTYVVTLLANADKITTACTVYKVNSDQSALSVSEVLSQTLQRYSYGKFFYNSVRNTLIFFSSAFSNNQIVEFNGTTLTETANGAEFSYVYPAKDAIYFYSSSSNQVVKTDLQFLNVDWYGLKPGQVTPALTSSKYSTGLLFYGQRTSDSKYVFGHVETDGSCAVDGEGENGASVLDVIKLN